MRRGMVWRMAGLAAALFALSVLLVLFLPATEQPRPPPAPPLKLHPPRALPGRRQSANLAPTTVNGLVGQPCMQHAGMSECHWFPGPVRPQCCCVLRPAPQQDEQTICLPTFAIVGSQKSGSTALFTYMLFHRHFEPPKRKELHFFDKVVAPMLRQSTTLPPDRLRSAMDRYLRAFSPYNTTTPHTRI